MRCCKVDITSGSSYTFIYDEFIAVQHKLAPGERRTVIYEFIKVAGFIIGASGFT